MDKDSVKHYSNGDITIVWTPTLCVHSAICWKGATGLASVFDPRRKPWIRPEGATSEKIIAQVNKCPSGALSYFKNDVKEEPGTTTSETRIEAVTNGPLMVYGNIVVKDNLGNETRKSKVTAFCRCGQSANKPFCDGSHLKYKFEG